MNLLRQLFEPLWTNEEQQKGHRYHTALTRMQMRLHRLIMQKDSPLQAKIRRWVGRDEPVPQDMSQHLYRQQALAMGQQAMAQTNAANIYSSNTINSQNLNTPGAVINWNSGNVTLTHGAGTMAIGSATPTWNSLYMPSASYAPYGIVFAILQAAEEACAADRMHRYDEDAIYMVDHRLHKSDIPVLWVASFALSNRMVPETLVTLLEGHGYKVVE